MGGVAAATEKKDGDGDEDEEQMTEVHSCRNGACATTTATDGERVVMEKTN